MSVAEPSLAALLSAGELRKDLALNFAACNSLTNNTRINNLVLTIGWNTKY